MEIDMKTIMLLLFCSTMLFAVKPVLRPDNKADVKNVKTASEVVQNKDKDGDENDKDKNTNPDKKDQFIDKNNDGVNDQREDDLQTIKNTKPKDRDPNQNKKVTTPPSDKKPVTPKKTNKK